MSQFGSTFPVIANADKGLFTAEIAGSASMPGIGGMADQNQATPVPAFIATNGSSDKAL